MDQLGEETEVKVVTGGDRTQATGGPAHSVVFSRDRTQGGKDDRTLVEHYLASDPADVVAQRGEGERTLGEH
jgi:hypothetical protein